MRQAQRRAGRKRRRARWLSYAKNMLRDYPDLTHGELLAVESALWQTAGKLSGEQRLKLIRLVYFEKSHTLTGAALAIPCSYECAKRWSRDFLRLCAAQRGLFS